MLLADIQKLPSLHSFSSIRVVSINIFIYHLMVFRLNKVLIIEHFFSSFLIILDIVQIEWSLQLNSILSVLVCQLNNNSVQQQLCFLFSASSACRSSEHYGFWSDFASANRGTRWWSLLILPCFISKLKLILPHNHAYGLTDTLVPAFCLGHSYHHYCINVSSGCQQTT